jgi:hypothetical protein
MSSYSSFDSNSTLHTQPPSLLPWYGVDGVPLKESGEGEVIATVELGLGLPQEPGDVAAGEENDVEQETGVLQEQVEEAAVLQEIGALTITESHPDNTLGLSKNAQMLTFGVGTEDEHESTTHKRRARRKRAIDSARKLRRSTRLAEKERPTYEDPNSKATRVQQARVDFSGASRRLRAALSKTHLISDPYLPTADLRALADVAVACGASEEDTADLQEMFGEPSGAE